MFILEIKYEDGTYGVLDMNDNSIDKCTRKEIVGFIKQGIEIEGVSIKNNKCYLRARKSEAKLKAENMRKQPDTVESISNDNSFRDLLFTGVSEFLTRVHRRDKSNFYSDFYLRLKSINKILSVVNINSVACLVNLEAELIKDNDDYIERNTYFLSVYYVKQDIKQDYLNHYGDASKPYNFGIKRGVYVAVCDKCFDGVECLGVVPITCKNSSFSFPSYAVVTRSLVRRGNRDEVLMKVFTTGCLCQSNVGSQWILLTTCFSNKFIDRSYDFMSTCTVLTKLVNSKSSSYDTLRLTFIDKYNSSKYFAEDIRIKEPYYEDLVYRQNNYDDTLDDALRDLLEGSY